MYALDTWEVHQQSKDFTSIYSHGSGSMTNTSSRLTTVQVELEKLFQDAFKQAFPALEEKPIIAPTKEAKFGDYQCNSAMKLFGMLKGKVSHSVQRFFLP